MSLYNDCIPDYTEDVWKFNKRFGSMGCEESTGLFAYGTKNKQYAFPNTTTKALLTDLIHKSLADNHDYVLDWVKKHGEEIVYEKGCIY